MSNSTNRRRWPYKRFEPRGARGTRGKDKQEEWDIVFFPVLPAAIPLWAVVTGLGVSVFVGLVFGVWPARKASRLDPIMCLRYE